MSNAQEGDSSKNNNRPTSAARKTIGSPILLPKAKQAWQTSAGLKKSGDTTSPTLQKPNTSQDMHHVVKKAVDSMNKGDVTPKSRSSETSSQNRRVDSGMTGLRRHDSNNGNKKECERKRSTSEALTTELQNTQEQLKAVEEDYAKARRKIESVEKDCSQQYHKNRSLQLDIKDREQDISSLRKDLSRKLSNIESLKKELKEANAKVRCVTNMEWKAMEYEKVNIMNENLKQKLDNQLTENRDLERRLRDRDKEISEKEHIIEIQAEEIEALQDKMLDLRLQVKEEAVKNSKLDEKCEVLEDVQKSLAERDEEVTDLRRKLEEAEILLLHAKKSYREERQKIKGFENEKKEEKTQAEEMELTISENLTLKRLIIAKDAILIQRSQAIDNLKNVLNTHSEGSIDVEMVRKILEKKPVIKPTFPIGNKVKQEQFSNGTVENGWFEESAEKKKPAIRRGDFLQAILGKEEPDRRFPYGQGHTGRVANGRRPQTAVVKPQQYVSSSFSNFRSESDTFVLETNRSSNDSQIKRWHTAKDVRHENQSGKNSLKSTNYPEPETSKMRRSKSMDNKISPADHKTEEHRPSSPSNFSTKSMSVATTIGSTGSSSVSAAMLKAAPQKDRLYCKVVRTGHRVMVDMAKSKGKRKQDYQAGVVKYIGYLDKEHDCYRIYIGVRLDEPHGDTDGLYKGKRYFKVNSTYGKFLRITKIVSIYNKETCKFESVAQLLGTEENGHAEEDHRVHLELDI